MAFLTVNEENVHKEGESSYISTSGIYDVHIKVAEVAKSKNGATQVNYYCDNINSFGNFVFDKNGKKLFSYDILEAATTVLGEDGLSDPESTELKTKKGVKEVQAIPELTDIDVKVWVSFSYNLYQGEIKEKVAFKRFYRASDGANGSEILSGKDFGKQLAKDEEHSTKIKYEDGLTAEDVTAWKKAQAEGAKASTPAAAPKKAAASFPGA